MKTFRLIVLLLTLFATLRAQSAAGKVCIERDGIALAELTLRPTSNSLIRVAIALPGKERWNGRLWFYGNGGAAGRLDWGCVETAARAGSIGVHTDMGTSVPCERLPPEVLTDFGHRATHLALLSAKELVKERFGRYPRYCYFEGESTGGGQGIHEALRYPQDFDGILAGVPANIRLPLHTYFWWSRREMTRNGAPVFTRFELQTLARVAKETLGKNDPIWCRGKWLADPRWTKERGEEVLAQAIRLLPSLGEGDKPERLRRLLEGPVLDGVRIHCGLPLGSVQEEFESLQFLLRWYVGQHRNLDEVGEGEIREWIKACSPELDASGTGLEGFCNRGGKLVVWVGLEDAVVPASAVMEWFGRCVGAMGVDRARSCLRLYALIGRGHVAGGSRGMQEIVNRQRLIEAWVERGVAPGLVPVRCGDGRMRPLEAYWPE